MTTPVWNDAFMMLSALLRQWGLESLTGPMQDMLVAGDSADVIPLKLRDTNEYKVRFKGNLDRIANGLPALSEAEFLATEASLKSVVRRYVGSGTYDTPENLRKWISGDLSPKELDDRMSLYQRRYQEQSVEARQAWAQAGLTPADAISALMDPSVTETELTRRASIYALGAAKADAYGTNTQLDPGRLGQLVDRGANVEQAREQFSDVASRSGYEDFLARTYATGLTEADQEDAALLNDGTAQRKRKKTLDTAVSEGQQNFLGGVKTLARDPSGSY